jgi:hypothetical protein
VGARAGALWPRGIGKPVVGRLSHLPKLVEGALQHQLALPGSVASMSDVFQRTLSIFTTLFAPQYVLRTVFRRSFRISDAVGGVLRSTLAEGARPAELT